MYVYICRERESIAAITMAPKDVRALIFRTVNMLLYMADVAKIKNSEKEGLS